MSAAPRTLAVAALLAGACGQAAPARRSSPAVPRAADPNSDEVALSANVPPLLIAEVRLIDPGAQPRKALRYHPRAGQTEPLLLELSTTLVLSVGEMSAPEVRTPVVRLTIDLVPLTVDGHGRMSLQGTLLAAEVRAGSAPAAIDRAIAADLERLVHTRFAARVSSRGLLEALAFPLPSDANPQIVTMAAWIREALRLLLPPLPDEPVGRGARWEGRRRAQVGPADADQTSVYTLTGLEDTQVRLAVKLGFSAGEQTPQVAGLPPGATLKLSSLTGTGAGTVELDPGRLQPHTSLRWSTTALGSSEPAGEPPAAVRMTTSVSLTVGPAPAEPVRAPLSR
jgi:hypothetical protein